MIENLGTRTSGNNLAPLIDASSNTASFESCFKTSHAQLSALGNKLTITVNLTKEMFVHAILLVQDVYFGHKPSQHTNTN